MRILYGYDQPLPAPGADAEQVFCTVAALARSCGVTQDELNPDPVE